MARSGVRRALAFLTPLGGPAGPTADALNWFPVVGALLGLILGGWWWLAGRVWPAPVEAALVVVADLALTGLLHFDGLLDSADGLLPHLPRDRRLAVMAEPRVGAFAVAVGGAVLLARWAALSAMPPAPGLMAGLWCGSRTLMAAVVRTQPYARDEGGLASAFLGGAGRTSLVVGAVAAVALAGTWQPLAGVAAAVSAALGGVAVVALARHQLRGYTGDVLGAAGIMAETVGLIVASAKW